MMKLSCRESGLECDYVAEGKTQDEVLKNISEHAVYSTIWEQKTYMKKIFLRRSYAKL
jgi:hypothetical protein